MPAARSTPRRMPPTKAPITTVEGYLKAKTRGWQTPVARSLLAIVAEIAPDATVSIKWGQPVWEIRGPVAWMRAATEHLSFGFWRGADLDDPHGILEGEGAKMRHTKITSEVGIRREALEGLLHQACALSRRDGETMRRR